MNHNAIGSTLEVLILTQPSRAHFLAQGYKLLTEQAQRLSLTDFARIKISIATFDDKLISLGANREQLRQRATGDYICFVDDDDFVSPDYFAKILPKLDGVVDYVGFDVRIFRNGQVLPTCRHSLKFGNWYEDRSGYYRDISHLNPMRRELALQVQMAGGIGEDSRWAQAMRGRVKTEAYIPEVLYFYLWRLPKNDRLDYMANWRFALYERLHAGRKVG